MKIARNRTMKALQKFKDKPITFSYPKPGQTLLDKLKQQDACIEVFEESGFIIGNDYYKMGLPGAIPRVFCREALYLRMQKLRELLSPGYAIYFFDVFRTKKNQGYLFNEFQKRIKKSHPELIGEALEIETRKYVSHPDEPTRFTAPPHNTGGAIDLAFVDTKTNKVLSYGSPIDYSESISATDFFEQDFDEAVGLTKNEWIKARENRRVLFHSMISLGFTNYPSEWWHYDLGDGMWAQATGEKTIFHSMETEAQAFLQQAEIV